MTPEQAEAVLVANVDPDEVDDVPVYIEPPTWRRTFVEAWADSDEDLS